MYGLLKPLLFRLDPEVAHKLVFGFTAGAGPLARGAMACLGGPPDAILGVTLAGLELTGPVGLAAGLDKTGSLARFWPHMGFGFSELGTVTALPQPGNPRPRLFRFPDQGALVNRMGFNNEGAEALGALLRGWRDSGWQPGHPVGVNLGKSKVTPLEGAVEDYRTSAGHVADVADYLVINVSSPNTPGLRGLQDPAHLSGILDAVVAEGQGKPVFVKLAPDLDDAGLLAACDVAREGGAAGIIATNTTIERPGIPDVGPGGLSGRPLHRRALEVVRLVAGRGGLPVIGVGGIENADHVEAMLAAGAQAVQVYSALIFHGPALVGSLHRELARRVRASGAADFGAWRDQLQGAES
jgi:dihydroorotate dehydrogenase